MGHLGLFLTMTRKTGGTFVCQRVRKPISHAAVVQNLLLGGMVGHFSGCAKALQRRAKTRGGRTRNSVTSETPRSRERGRSTHLCGCTLQGAPVSRAPQLPRTQFDDGSGCRGDSHIGRCERTAVAVSGQNHLWPAHFGPNFQLNGRKTFLSGRVVW